MSSSILKMLKSGSVAHSKSGGMMTHHRHQLHANGSDVSLNLCDSKPRIQRTLISHSPFRYVGLLGVSAGFRCTGVRYSDGSLRNAWRGVVLAFCFLVVSH